MGQPSEQTSDKPMSDAEYAALDISAHDRYASFQSGRYIREHPSNVNWNGISGRDGRPAPEFDISVTDPRYKECAQFADDLRKKYRLDSITDSDLYSQQENKLINEMLGKIHNVYGNYNPQVAKQLQGSYVRDDGLKDDWNRALKHARGTGPEPSLAELGKDKLICRHYAPLAAALLDRAGVKCIAVNGDNPNFDIGTDGCVRKHPDFGDEHSYVVTLTNKIVETTEDGPDFVQVPYNNVTVSDLMQGKSFIIDTGQNADGTESISMYGTNPNVRNSGYDENGNILINDSYTQAYIDSFHRREIENLLKEQQKANQDVVAKIKRMYYDLYGQDGFNFNANQIADAWDRDKTFYTIGESDAKQVEADFKSRKDALSDYKKTIATYADELHIPASEKPAFQAQMLSTLDMASIGTDRASFIASQTGALKKAVNEIKQHPELEKPWREYHENQVIQGVLDETQIRTDWDKMVSDAHEQQAKDTKQLSTMSDVDKKHLNKDYLHNLQSSVVDRLEASMSSMTKDTADLKTAIDEYKRNYYEVARVGNDDVVADAAWRYAATQPNTIPYKIEHHKIDTWELQEAIESDKQLFRVLHSPPEKSSLLPASQSGKFAVSDTAHITAPLPVPVAANKQTARADVRSKEN